MIPVRVRVIACDKVFSGLFFNGAESGRDPDFYKNVAEIEAFDESVSARRDDADPVGDMASGDQTRVL
jgi:hypothetical protein